MKWINIEDKIPPRSTYWEDQSIPVLASVSQIDQPGINISHPQIVIHFKNDLAVIENTGYGCRISHWMPLPELPNEMD